MNSSTYLSTILFYVERNRNVSAFGALIGWIIGAGQSVRLAWSRFDLVQHKAKSHQGNSIYGDLALVFPKVDVQYSSRGSVVCYCATKCE